jgi:hypothetical protein
MFLEWHPLPVNPMNANNPNNQANNANKETSILNKLGTHNFYHHLFILWLVDHKNIYTTIVEVMIFAMVYNFHSIVLASKEVI